MQDEITQEVTELTELETLQLYHGATSEVEFDFSEFVFEPNTHCLLTIKNTYNDDIVFEKEFSKSEKYTIIFTDEFTATLTNDRYRYDIMYIINNERYPQCKPSKVEVREVVGSYE